MNRGLWLIVCIIAVLTLCWGCSDDLHPGTCHNSTDCDPGQVCSPVGKCVPGTSDAAPDKATADKATADNKENTAARCKDGKDNDGDGHVDCKDQDCQVFVFCVTKDGGPPKPDGPGPKPDGPGPKPDGPGPKPDGPGPKPDGPGPKPDGPGPVKDGPGPKPDVGKKCGNGVLDSGEQCDGVKLGGKSCKTEGFDGGALSCKGCQLDTSKCHKCGDNTKNGAEQCDGIDLGNKTCKSEGFDSGSLGCKTNCTLETSACQKCGDNKMFGAEQCDGTDMGGKTCKTEGFDAGTLGCKPDCKVDTSKCTKCGDNKKNGAEKCDGTDLDGQDCTKQGFDSGTLACSSTCTFDTAGCVKCGDGKLSGSEECDGADLGGASCAGKGFTSGTPGCSAKCLLDYGYCRTGGYKGLTSGSFKMGSPSSDPCRQSNEAYHTVTLTHKFEIQQAEVTQTSFQKVRGYNPSSKKGSSRPVEMVSWHEAAAYCNKGSTVTSQTPCYSCSGSGKSVSCAVASQFKGNKIYGCPGFRLPTEAEWEYAYRAGTSSSTYKGTIKNCKGYDGVANAAGWFSGNSGGQSRNVCSKKNGWGLCDMAGNVWEWTNDWSQTNLGTSPRTDPAGPASGSQKVIRGGAFNSYAMALRAASRGPHPKSKRYNMLGFRCVRSIK